VKDKPGSPIVKGCLLLYFFFIRCTEKTHTEKKDVLCVYIRSIYNKGREKKKEGEQKEKTVGEWKRREEKIYMYVYL
jgi:hypothetical protein